ncbi:MAG: hypothetical protein COU11_02740 [Candidatus Harrisonbacteria bacterium CG10_big_fil_rev_8_21_14_0_10_49_15]|uniref:Uncharacterized protein n=1 Tax=Candidatus Harrisonbacteria bacterium CG10_big_fil_rev_8_21_14_0_10_49_15 TaxID=1974587 RepID=A0A2H0UL59_9BACT|nr:MAG: hypothetical protein COU11_02740 [Candidatus Harrisonbacteria bacterium CG10_big_fil_rev_8_21_14_0_10_49_15]
MRAFVLSALAIVALVLTGCVSTLVNTGNGGVRLCAKHRQQCSAPVVPSADGVCDAIGCDAPDALVLDQMPAPSATSPVAPPAPPPVAPGPQKVDITVNVVDHRSSSPQAATPAAPQPVDENLRTLTQQRLHYDGEGNLLGEEILFEKERLPPGQRFDTNKAPAPADSGVGPASQQTPAQQGFLQGVATHHGGACYRDNRYGVWRSTTDPDVWWNISIGAWDRGFRARFAAGNSDRGPDPDGYARRVYTRPVGPITRDAREAVKEVIGGGRRRSRRR